MWLCVVGRVRLCAEQHSTVQSTTGQYSKEKAFDARRWTHGLRNGTYVFIFVRHVSAREATSHGERFLRGDSFFFELQQV